MTEYFVKVTPDGQIDVVEYTGEVELFRFLRDQIDCRCIESVCSLSGTNHMLVVDEEFLCRDPQPQFNCVASYLYSQFAYPICGTALLGFQGFRDGEPDLVGFGFVEAMRIVSKLKRIRSALEHLEVV